MSISRIFFTLIIWATCLQAQNYLDLLRPFNGMEGRNGFRANLDMAGVFDENALLANPAALTGLDRAFVSMDMSYDQISGTSILDSTVWNEISDNRLTFNGLGIVFPVPVYRGSWVWAASIQPVSFFDSRSFFDDFDPVDSYRYTKSRSEEGALYGFSLGTAVLFTRTISLGITVSYLAGENKWEKVYHELDVFDIYEYDNYLDSLRIQVRYSGFGIRSGILINLQENLLIGASIEFPERLAVDESSMDYESKTMDINYPGAYTSEIPGNLDFRLWGPWRLGLGISYDSQHIQVSLNYRYHAYRSMNFSSDIYAEGEDEPIDKRIEGEVDRYIDNVNELSASVHMIMQPFQISAGFTSMGDPVNYHLSDIFRLDFGISYSLNPSLGFYLAFRDENRYSDLSHQLDSGIFRVVDVQNEIAKFVFGLKYFL